MNWRKLQSLTKHEKECAVLCGGMGAIMSVSWLPFVAASIVGGPLVAVVIGVVTTSVGALYGAGVFDVESGE